MFFFYYGYLVLLMIKFWVYNLIDIYDKYLYNRN